MAENAGEEFSVVVLASDLGVDARSFLSPAERQAAEDDDENVVWHDCHAHLIADEDFSDLEVLQAFRLEGADKAGNRILRIVGKYFPGLFDSKPYFSTVAISSFFLSFLIDLLRIEVFLED